MFVKNLVHWAGDRFAYEPGDVVKLEDPVAKARIDAGLAEAVRKPREKNTEED